MDDVVLALTDSANVKDYIKKLRKRDPELDSYWGTNCPPVEMIAADGKRRKIKAAHTEALLRLIQSIPSPKAEPFKLWLAKVGYERLEEIENPELAAKRMREIYEQKGYSEEWIEKRLRGIAVRDELTDEWKKRGVKQGKEFAILTAEISKATFGMTPSEYKEFKALSNPRKLQSPPRSSKTHHPEKIIFLNPSHPISQPHPTRYPCDFPTHVGMASGGKRPKFEVSDFPTPAGFGLCPRI